MSALLRLALDQNFPTPLLQAVQQYLPADLQLTSVHRIDPALSELSDRALFIALKQLDIDGLITNNYKMLDVPEELAAIVATKSVLVAVEGLGHDPIRAVGALLLELPGLAGRVRPGVSNVFRLTYRRRIPEDAWHYLSIAAERRGVTAQELWAEVRLTDEELPTPGLDQRWDRPAGHSSGHGGSENRTDAVCGSRRIFTDSAKLLPSEFKYYRQARKGRRHVPSLALCRPARPAFPR